MVKDIDDGKIDFFHRQKRIEKEKAFKRKAETLAEHKEKQIFL